MDTMMPKNGESNGLWFLNNQVTIGLSKADNQDGVSVLLLRLPHDEAPPLHVHHAEDEIFHVIRGEVRFKVGERSVTARAGDTLLGPRGVPHGFRVVSPEGAEMLTVTRGGFEDMVRTMARPAQRPELPAPMTVTPAMERDFAAACSARQIEFVGAPVP